MMKKYLLLFFVGVMALSCGTGAKKKAMGGSNDVLTVTIEPQRYFLEQIVGEAFTVNTLVPKGTSPETYEPAPSVMVDMGRSSLYFMVGDLGFEKTWSVRLAENNPELTIVNCSKGIELMEGHEHHHHDGHAHHHEGMDPHVWSSPKAMRVFTSNMLDALVEEYPDRADFLLDNYKVLEQTILHTDSVVKSLLEDSPIRSFIIYHPALGYFAKDYGLHQYSIEFEGKNPSPAQIKELIDVARKEGINTVFIQRGFDKKNGEVIAAEVGAELFEIDPLAYEWNEELIRLATILSRGTE